MVWEIACVTEGTIILPGTWLAVHTEAKSAGLIIGSLTQSWGAFRKLSDRLYSVLALLQLYAKNSLVHTSPMTLLIRPTGL